MPTKNKLRAAYNTYKYQAKTNGRPFKDYDGWLAARNERNKPRPCIICGALFINPYGGKACAEHREEYKDFYKYQNGGGPLDFWGWRRMREEREQRKNEPAPVYTQEEETQRLIIRQVVEKAAKIELFQ